MAGLDQLVQTGVGSTDWAGNRAPSGGTHTGTATITMQDGAQFTVASNRAEVLQKLALFNPGPPWVCFDQVNSAVPLILNSSNIVTVR